MDGSLLRSGEFLSALSALLWAVAVILFRKSGESLPPLALNLFKGVVGLLCFLPTLLIMGVPLLPADVPAADWLVLFGTGAVGIGIADTLFFVSLNRLGAGRSAIVDCLYSPFIMLCSFVYLEEPIGLNLLLGLALMTGAILVGTLEPAAETAPAERRAVLRAVILGVISMFLMAAGIVAAKPVLGHTHVAWATTVRLSGGVAWLALQALLVPRFRAGLARAFCPSKLWRVTLPAGFIGTYVALIIWVAGMKYTQTTIASVLNQLSSVFVIIFATLFLKERLTWRKNLAITMGFLGGVLAVANLKDVAGFFGF